MPILCADRGFLPLKRAVGFILSLFFPFFLKIKK